jgi:hypothetical protein
MHGLISRLNPRLSASAFAPQIRARITGFQALFVLVLLLGVFARVWEFGSLPPGLNQDEATNAVDAYSLLHFGIDRNGVSWPVEFIGWGSGVSALYGYVLIPFIALGGLSPFIVRLPMLLSGIAALPLMFHVGSRLGGRQFGLLAMFLLSISPWHIVASRWGLEAGFLPFVFLLAFVCLVESTRDNYWFIPGCVFLALCLYTYGPAYAAIPIFLGCAAIILLVCRRVRFTTLVVGAAVFAAIAAPIALFVYINAMRLGSISLGPLTMPRLPGQPRFMGQAAFFSEDTLVSLKKNAHSLLSLMWTQTDGRPWNTVEPYGYFYKCTFPLAVIGGFFLIPLRWQHAAEKLLVIAWLGSAMTLGLLQQANINRIGLVFIPLLLATAALLDWLRRHFAVGFSLAILALLIGFTLFTRDYHGPFYRDQVNGPFFTGFLDALDFAHGYDDRPICVTTEARMPYIFVLFVEKMDPAEYLPTIEYDNPRSSFRQPRFIGRYRFGLDRCLDHSAGTIYVLDQMETLPGAEEFDVKAFGNFRVYLPRS